LLFVPFNGTPVPEITPLNELSLALFTL